MIIYFRVCEKQQTISNVMRYNNISKTEMIKKCWISIQHSISPEDTIIIIHDSVTEDTLQWLCSTSNTAEIELVEVEEHSWDIHAHTIALVDSLEHYAAKYPEELHYILEDDYLHVPDSIRILENSLAKWPHFAVSYDYPDRYTSTPEHTQVIIGMDRHWRTISSSTMTVLAKGSTWLRHISALKEAAPTSNDQVFSAIYKKEPCISPMPGLSTHMTQHHMTPLVNWESYWEVIDID